MGFAVEGIPCYGTGIAYWGAGLADILDPIAPHLDAIDFIEATWNSRAYDPRQALAIAPRPLIFHTMHLNVPSTDPVDAGVLAHARWMIETLGAPWYAEDLTITSVSGIDAIGIGYPPLFTREMRDLCTDRIRDIQDRLGVPFLVEMGYGYNFFGDYDPIAFHRDLVEAADCGFLLDVGHMAILCHSLGVDPAAALGRLPLDRVLEIHITDVMKRPDGLWQDTHAGRISEDLLALLRLAVPRCSNLRAVTVESYNTARIDWWMADLRRVRATLADLAA